MPIMTNDAFRDGLYDGYHSTNKHEQKHNSCEDYDLGVVEGILLLQRVLETPMGSVGLSGYVRNPNMQFEMDRMCMQMMQDHLYPYTRRK